MLTTFNVTNWFGLDDYSIQSEFSDKVNELLQLYYDGLHEIFDIPSTSTFKEYLSIVEGLSVKKADKLFIKWLKEIAEPTLNNIISFDFGSCSPAIEKLNYMINSYRTELDWDNRSKQSTRSNIVNGITDLDNELLRIFESFKNAINNQSVIESYYSLTHQCLTYESLEVLFDSGAYDLNLFETDIMVYNGNVINTTGNSSIFYF